MTLLWALCDKMELNWTIFFVLPRTPVLCGCTSCFFISVIFQLIVSVSEISIRCNLIYFSEQSSYMYKAVDLRFGQ